MLHSDHVKTCQVHWKNHIALSRQLTLRRICLSVQDRHFHRSLSFNEYFRLKW